MRRPSVLTRLVVVALLVVLAGCSAQAALTDVPTASAGPLAPDGVSLAADQASYARGATAHLTLRNGAPRAAQMGVLSCAQIETWTGGAWTLSPVGNDRACILMLVSVAPGETVTGDVPLDVPAGTYRLVQSVGFEGRDASETAATAAFRVTG